MPMPAIYDRLFQAEVRIEVMWPFPVFNPPEALVEAFEDAGELPGDLAQLIDRWPEEEKDQLFSGDERDFQVSFDELVAAGNRKQVWGWIAVAACPVFRPAGGGSVSYSWGYYSTKLLFAKTATGILSQAAKWAEGLYEAATKPAAGEDGAQ